MDVIINEAKIRAVPQKTNSFHLLDAGAIRHLFHKHGGYSGSPVLTLSTTFISTVTFTLCFSVGCGLGQDRLLRWILCVIPGQAASCSETERQRHLLLASLTTAVFLQDVKTAKQSLSFHTKLALLKRAFRDISLQHRDRAVAGSN